MVSRLVVFGNRTAQEVREAAELAFESRFESISTEYFEEEKFFKTLVPKYESSSAKVYYFAAVADIRVRQQIVRVCDQANWSPISIVHPSAVISRSAKIDSGVFIGPLAVVSSNATIGAHSIVHIHASVGHDATIGEGATILPGARISGNVRLGKHVLVGSNAFLNADIEIGDESHIDALTYVVRSVPEKMIVSVRASSPMRRVGF